ncbi:hypothetical protein MTR67_012950 [Solanum verrucosum]|uniref:Uncharacterized protein n=1 Tax=Solanum verrucosum TaxID=315347 RepID=A0AAF0QC87_SOLVR|nr:hypothetical protein MTR67_012950 [Solanum verrucosum]
MSKSEECKWCRRLLQLISFRWYSKHSVFAVFGTEVRICAALTNGREECGVQKCNEF